MIGKDQIIDSFNEIGVDVSSDVLDKCIQLCTRYGLSENDIVDEWMAFTVSSSEDMPITIEALTLMEKKVLSKKRVNKSTSRFGNSPSVENNCINLMDVDVPAQYQTSLNNTTENSENVKTPVSNRFKDARAKYASHSPRSLFSPSSYSPISSVRSKKYDERTNSGEVICRFGENRDSVGWRTNLYQPHSVDIADKFQVVPSNISFMFETIAERIQASQRHADRLSVDIVENNGIEFSDQVNCDSVIETSKYAGSIVCDSNGKLNPSSVLLHYCMCKKVGKFAKLQLSGISDFSIFPGQVVVIEGKNRTGERIVVEKLYTDVKLPMCPSLREFPLPWEPLQIIIAAGPYSLSETMSYQPMIDLAKYIQEHKPHVAILIGPIIDCSHAELSQDKLDSSFPEYFEEILKQFLSTIKKYQTSLIVDKLHTKIVFVSHWREAGQSNLYPTPIPRLSSRMLEEMPNVQFVPDPCIVDICGFHIGLTGADILMHLGKEELFCSATPGVDRLGRVASHLLQQKNFYPLRPPPEEMTIDTDLLLKHAIMPFKPHVLVLPSELKCFVKNVFGCIVINPEKLCKGQVGGNFARIAVKAASSGENWTPETHVSAQIVKI